MTGPAPERIAAARAAAAGVIRRTPVITSRMLTERCGADVVLKAENLQRTGSFKIRGTLAKLAELGDAAGRGVVAGSAGNHAQALAYAARHRGVPCEIFVPDGASISKTEASKAYGATVVLGGESVDEAVQAAKVRAREAGMAFVHPFDDLAVVAGQATMGRELLEDVPDVGLVVVPLGGGGLAGGVALALKRERPDVRVVGVEVAACAPYADRPPPPGPIVTLADGIAVKRPGRVTRPLVERWVDEVVVVDEDDVADAMVALLERSKLVVEGAGAVGVAALMSERTLASATGTTVVVLSGGNVDLGVLPGLIRRTETRAGRRAILFARISDRPGGLTRLLAVVAEQRANLLDVEHVREGVDLHVRETGVRLVIEVRDRQHTSAVLDAAKLAGYDLRDVSRL